MINIRRLLFVHLLLTLLSVVSAAQGQAVVRPQPVARVVTIKFESKMVKTELPYNVVLPAGYDEAKTENYPVLYLLHGLIGHYTDWTSKTKLAEYANQYRLIIITPEGNNGWYTDSVKVPTDKYETYIVEELIPDVERRFRAARQRSFRAIAGLSMGGYGALKFGIKHRDKFVFAASMSGALDAAKFTEEGLKGAEWIWKTMEPVYGPPGSETRNANDLSKLYSELAQDQIANLPFLYIDCGTEDILLASNQGFVQLLVSRKIPHEYRQLPGAHNWTYWDRQIREVLRIASARMEPPATPKQ